MKKLSTVFAVSTILLAQNAFALTPQEMLQRATETLYPGSYRMEAEMTTSRPGKKDQVYRMVSLKKGDDKALIEFTYPAAERERKILRVKDNLWMYMPSIKRAIRIAPKDRLLGGDVSNNDMTRVDFNVDYTASLTGKVDFEGKKVAHLTLKAKNPSVPYDRVEFLVDAQSYIPYKMSLYTQSGMLLKTIDYDAPKFLDGMLRPTKLVYRNPLQEGYVTKVEITSIETKSFPDSMFTQAALSR